MKQELSHIYTPVSSRAHMCVDRLSCSGVTVQLGFSLISIPAAHPAFLIRQPVAKPWLGGWGYYVCMHNPVAECFTWSAVVRAFSYVTFRIPCQISCGMRTMCSSMKMTCFCLRNMCIVVVRKCVTCDSVVM